MSDIGGSKGMGNLTDKLRDRAAKLAGKAADKLQNETGGVTDSAKNVTGGVSDGVTDRVSGSLPGGCLLYTSPSPRDATLSRMPSSA